jgi:hypothetical protein
LNCNKIKQLNVSKEDIIEAIKQSSSLELDTAKEKVRRKDNKPLPELSLLKKKRNPDSSLTKKEDKVKEEKDIDYDP